MTRIGSMFTGYGGLDMAVLAHFGGALAWYAEIEPAASKVLTAHHPGVPNLGDVTRIDWTEVEPVDAITAGYPCQPFSQAGKRKGTNDERHLWPYVRDAIDAIRPRLVVLENVRGHLTLGFGDVLADLSRMGYDARWGVVRASDAGAPHHRARLFIVANPGDRSLAGIGAAGVGLPEPAERGTEPAAYPNSIKTGSRGRGRMETQNRDNAYRRIVRCNPESGLGCADNEEQSAYDEGIVWGEYRAAIRRWESLTRPAPAPTIAGANGKQRLSPSFVEWMMGLPDGHVTGHGLSSAQALKMLGNGVVPQQARLALGMLSKALIQ